MKNHPLFPEHPDADIEGFHVTRVGEGYAHSLHSPEAITELSHVFDLYGGGKYELVARGVLSGKNGEKGKKGIVARQAYQIPGASKPLNPTAPGESPPVMREAAREPQSDTGMMLQFLGQQMSAQMTLMGTIITAALSSRGGDGGATAAIQALGEVVKATLQRPEHAAAPAQGPQDQLKLIMDLGDWLNGVRSGAAAIAQKAAAGEDTTIDLNNLVEAANRAVDVVKKAKGIAESGTPPHVAADELARAAAE